MQKTNINIQPENTKCILFFNGWGMDSAAVSHFEKSKYDVIEFSDYSDLELPFIELEKYNKIYLIAWSMGVWAAQTVCSKLPIQFTKKIAINGTGIPMDNNFGIATDVFIGTLENWNETVRTKFNMRMCGGITEFKSLEKQMSNRTIENQKTELQSIYNVLLKNPEPIDFKWDKVMVGVHDLIFTAENQKKYWEGKTNWFTLPLPHYPFMRLKSWIEIIEFGE